MKCPHCKHIWEYKGKLKQATCPNCSLKVKVMKGGNDGRNKNKEHREEGLRSSDC